MLNYRYLCTQKRARHMTEVSKKYRLNSMEEPTDEMLQELKIITFPIITISTDVMELTKSDKRQLKDIIRRGILRRCEEWLKETGELINKEYSDDENAFDRCMEVTKRSRDYFKEAMGREDYYRNTMIELGVYVLLREGYLSFEDLTELRPEVQSDIKQRMNL